MKLTRAEEVQIFKAMPPESSLMLPGPERDRQLVKEMTEIIRETVGSLRVPKYVEGVRDGRDTIRDFKQEKFEATHDEAVAAHRVGKHTEPQLDCPRCVASFATFRRRRDARMDVVVALGGKCALCHEPVRARAAAFVHRRGGKSTITQMFQYSHDELVAEARDNYALLCPGCRARGGRRKIVERELASIPIGVVPRRGRRADKGTRKGKRGETTRAM